MAATTSQRLRLALAPPPPPPQLQKSRPAKSNIAQAARADASAQLSASEQTFGLTKRTKALVVNEENISKSSRRAPTQLQIKPPSERPTGINSHLKHLQSRAAVANRAKQPTWKSSTSALYSSSPPQPPPSRENQAIERRRRGATATASLTAATSLLQLNTTPATTNTTTSGASPNCQSATSTAFRQQQQQIANQRRASSLAAEINFLKSRSSGSRGSTQHLEALREGAGGRCVSQTGAWRRVVPIANSRVSLAQQRAKSVVGLNTYAVAKSTTSRSVASTCYSSSSTSSKPHSSGASCSPSARAAIHPWQRGNQGAQIHTRKQSVVAQKPASAVTNSRVRQGVLFARRQLHLTPLPASSPAPAHSQVDKIQPQVAKSLRATPAQASTKTATTPTATTCRRQLTRLTRAQPRPLAAKKQSALAGPTEANKLARVVSPTCHAAGSTRQRAHLLFESASRRARAGHNQHKKLSIDSSSSSSLDAPIAHIKRPRADPPQAQSPEQLERRRASLAEPGTGEQSHRRRWSSLESGSANEASSTPVSCSSLSSSSSSSCLLVAVALRGCAPVDTHEERSGRQRRRRRNSTSAEAAGAATTGNRHGAATADVAARARQHVVVAAASIVDPLANTREQQEKVPSANDDDERICDIHSSRQTNLDYSSTILINSSDTDKLFLQQQPKPLGQALIIFQSPLTSNLDSNQPLEATDAICNNNNNNNTNQCVCIVGRQPSTIENANADASCSTSECLYSKSMRHQLRRRQSIGDEDVSAPTRVADRAFPIKDGQQNNNQDDKEANEPMVLSTDEPQHYQSGQLERLESTQVLSPPLSQLQQQQQQEQQRRRQSQSSSPMSCDLGDQGGQDENTNLVAILSAGANKFTATISEQPSQAKTHGEQIGISKERRASHNQVEMSAASGHLKAINIEQIQNQDALQQTPTAAAAGEDDESFTDESGPASKKHQPESILTITQLPIKSYTKTDHQISISQDPISDIYDLETRPFARGKFAQVKRCVRRDTRQCFAAKCIKKRRRLVDIKHEILLEIEALKLSYQTEYIVKLYEVYETPNEMVLILEMANGGELQRVLDDEEAIEEPLVRKMIKQILEGLVHLHDNQIAHLDIKPQNLLLTEPFPNGDVKLCDFGISRRITKDSEIRDICGTPDYVAPEILRYDPISLATDMWSLGVLTYVLLSGYSPFGSENKQQTFCNITQANLDFPIEIFGKISEDAVDFIRKLIVREPSGRLTSRQALSHHWTNQ